MSKVWHREPYRLVELGSIALFLLFAVLLPLANPFSPAQDPVPATGTGVEASAIAMPNQGWAPLTVYFSAYGSVSKSGTVVRYEWDLDANGRFETDASSQQGYTSYHYAKPGDREVALRVTDDQGNVAVSTVTIHVRHPGSSSVDYWSVFDDTRVRRVDVSLTSADWQYMWSDPPAKIQVPADVVVFGEPLNDVGFRMRGQFSLRESGEKKPWKFDIDAYVEGQEYRNLRQLMFINNIGDPTMLREKMAYDMMRFAGVPASHACFVEMWIDLTDDERASVFWGVYTMVERVDKKFLASRFGNDHNGGNLYKANHAPRGPMDLIYYGARIEDYPTQNGLYAYGKATNEEAADYDDILELIAVVDGTVYDTPEDFAEVLEQHLNVDSFLRYMAVVNTLGNWDSYPYTGNNYYLFHNAGTGRFEWIPWDLGWGGDPRHPLFELGGGGLVERAPLYERVMEVDRYRTRYAGYLDLLARQWFTYEHVSALAARYHSAIAPYVRQATGDKMYYGDTALFSAQAFDSGWIGLGEFARERNRFIVETLSALPAQ